MVLHRSKRCACAVEEPWSAFANGPVFLDRPPSGDLAPAAVLERARALVGTRWRALTQNCEHFVAIARGEDRRSVQVRSHAAAGAVAFGAGFAVMTALASRLG